jgi:hypothetical protein
MVPVLIQSSQATETPALAQGRNQIATKNTKGHKKLHEIEIFVSLRVLCGDPKLAHAAKFMMVSNTTFTEKSK